MEILTRDFGKVEIEEEDVIAFPQGLPGFPGEHEFVLLSLGEDSLFWVLQSANSPEVAFVTVEPWYFIPEYEFEIGEQIENQLGVENPEEVIVLVIGTVPDELEEMTVNLAAPVVINHEERIARQVILDDDEYPVRRRIFPAGTKAGVG